MNQKEELALARLVRFIIRHHTFQDAIMNLAEKERNVLFNDEATIDLFLAKGEKD